VSPSPKLVQKRQWLEFGGLSFSHVCHGLFQPRDVVFREREDLFENVKNGPRACYIFRTTVAILMAVRICYKKIVTSRSALLSKSSLAGMKNRSPRGLYDFERLPSGIFAILVLSRLERFDPYLSALVAPDAGLGSRLSGSVPSECQMSDSACQYGLVVDAACLVNVQHPFISSWL